MAPTLLMVLQLFSILVAAVATGFALSARRNSRQALELRDAEYAAEAHDLRVLLRDGREGLYERLGVAKSGCRELQKVIDEQNAWLSWIHEAGLHVWKEGKHFVAAIKDEPQDWHTLEANLMAAAAMEHATDMADIANACGSDAP